MKHEDGEMGANGGGMWTNGEMARIESERAHEVVEIDWMGHPPRLTPAGARRRWSVGDERGKTRNDRLGREGGVRRESVVWVMRLRCAASVPEPLEMERSGRDGVGVAAMAPAIPEKASSVVVAAETAAAPLAMDARSTGEYVIRLEGIHALQSAQERMLRWMARQEESLQTLHKRLDEVERQLRGRCPLPHAAHRAPHRLGTERQTRAYAHYTEGPATPDKCRAHDAHGHDPDATDWVQQAARRLQDIANRVPSTASVDGMHNRAAAAAAAAAPVASGQWIWVSMPAAGAPSEDETGAPWAGTASLTDHDIQR
eukprot:ctg_655.g329